MAEIKMDVSEYEVMKENTQLLKNALEREKKLSDKIEKLNKEKIKILEDSKYQVSYISKVRRTEYVLVKRDFREIMTRVQQIKNVREHAHLTSTYLDENFYNLFFEMKSIDSIDLDQEITTRGLDDVKVELREEEKKKLGEAYKKAIEENKELKNIKKDYLELQKKGAAISNMLHEQYGIVKELTDEVEDLEQELEDKTKSIVELSEKAHNEIDRYKGEILLVLNTSTFFTKDKIRKLLFK